MKETYTTGEFAKLAGVSYKTIRHYIERGLLKPIDITESGYKLFDKSSLEELQRIIMFKYLNFSLDEIKEMLEDKRIDSFEKQEKLLIEQKEHIELVIKAVRQIQNLSEEERWSKMIDIVQMTSRKEEIKKQYASSNNLQKRIDIHQYSTANESWFDWLYDRMNIKSGMKILEIGCGNGKLWDTICKRLPQNLTIYMTDNSEGMLEDAKKRLAINSDYIKNNNTEFIYMKKDAECFEIEESGFDRVIANHMLYHISSSARDTLLKYCANIMKSDGMFVASTIGNSHLTELFEFVYRFDASLKMPYWFGEGFNLENGKPQLESVFKNVSVEEHKNDLIVDNADAIYDYLMSLPEFEKQMLSDRKILLRRAIEKEIEVNKYFFIHKSTGVCFAIINI